MCRSGRPSSEEIDALAGKVDRAIRARRPAVGQKAGRGVT